MKRILITGLLLLTGCDPAAMSPVNVNKAESDSKSHENDQGENYTAHPSQGNGHENNDQEDEDQWESVSESVLTPATESIDGAFTLDATTNLQSVVGAQMQMRINFDNTLCNNAVYTIEVDTRGLNILNIYECVTPINTGLKMFEVGPNHITNLRIVRTNTALIFQYSQGLGYTTVWTTQLSSLPALFQGSVYRKFNNISSSVVSDCLVNHIQADCPMMYQTVTTLKQVKK